MTTTGLVDLLKLPLASRGESLRRTWPHPLDASLTGHNGVSWTEKEKVTIDIAVLIVRAVNSHCDPLDPSLLTEGVTAEERRKTEKRTLLLRYAWYNTPLGMTDDVLKLQNQLCERVLHGQPDFTFERLIKRGVMARSFWSRRELLAWSLTEKVREQGAESWARQTISSIPTLNGQSEVKNSGGDAAILEQLAFRSLFKWKWDGETQLAGFLTSKVKLEWSSAGGSTHHQGIRAWPSCLRARFDPAGRDDAPRFMDLTRLSLGETINYRLLATVKLGGEGLRDSVRVYDSDCRDSRPFAAQKAAMPHVDDEWELGEPGSRYMLYYIECGSEWAPSLPPKEFIMQSSLEIETRRQIKAMREAIREVSRPAPPPYGLITLPEPDPACSGWEQEDRYSEGSAYDGFEKDPTGHAFGNEPSDGNPRAKTLQRVKEMGGDIDEYYGFA